MQRPLVDMFLDIPSFGCGDSEVYSSGLPGACKASPQNRNEQLLRALTERKGKVVRDLSL